MPASAALRLVFEPDLLRRRTDGRCGEGACGGGGCWACTSVNSPSSASRGNHQKHAYLQHQELCHTILLEATLAAAYSARFVVVQAPDKQSMAVSNSRQGAGSSGYI